MSDQFSRPCTEEDRQLLSSLGLTFCLEEKDRKGSSWSAEEDHKLCEAFKANIAIEAIALNHKRSVGGIRSRLKKNQLIEYEDGKWQVVKVASSQSVKISKPNQNDYANCTSLNIPQKNEPIAPETSRQNLSPDQLDPQSLHAFGLISTRLKNCLESMNIEKIQDSFNLTPGKLIRTKNFGRQSIKELRNFQSKYFSDMNPLEDKKKKISSNDIMNSLDYHIEDINDYKNQVDKNISNNLYENDLKKVQNIFDKIKYYKNILKDLDYKALEIRYDVNLDKKNSEDWHDNGANAQKILELILNIIHFSVKNVRDAHIINLRIGLSEFGVPLTLEQVGNIYNVTRERIRQIEKKSMGIICKNIYFPSTNDTYELRNLAKFMFLNKGEKPLEIIYIYLSKYFGRSIKGSEIVILLSLSIGLFKSRKEAISEILKLEKKIFEASKLEISQLLNDKSSLLKWSEVFSQTIYPDEVKLFDEKHSILNNRLREPSKGSLGQIGSFFSKKCGRNILYESGEEYRLYQIMENASKVVYYQEQPLAIPYKSYFKNKEYLYYPDIAVLTNDGRLVVIEVKPIISMVEQFTLEKSIAAISYLHDRGIGFNLVDASGNSIKKMRLFGENRLIEQKMLKIIDEKGILDYQTYKSLIENTRLTGKQFAGFVVRNDLSLLRFPFRISRLPRELTFKIFG